MSRPRFEHAPLDAVLRPVGILRSDQQLHHEAPRQAGLGRGATGVVEIAAGLQNCLADLRGFSHVWLLWWAHLAKGFAMRVQPPRDAHKRGLFATRAPNRPNPIGLSCVRLLRIERRRLHVADHDLLDGTPILDVKPYLPYCDSVADAAIGYVAGLPDAAADHRDWWEQKPAPLPTRYRQRRRGDA